MSRQVLDWAINAGYAEIHQKLDGKLSFSDIDILIKECRDHCSHNETYIDTVWIGGQGERLISRCKFCQKVLLN